MYLSPKQQDAFSSYKPLWEDTLLWEGQDWHFRRTGELRTPTWGPGHG